MHISFAFASICSTCVCELQPVCCLKLLLVFCHWYVVSYCMNITPLLTHSALVDVRVAFSYYD